MVDSGGDWGYNKGRKVFALHGGPAPHNEISRYVVSVHGGAFYLSFLIKTTIRDKTVKTTMRSS